MDAKMADLVNASYWRYVLFELVIIKSTRLYFLYIININVICELLKYDLAVSNKALENLQIMTKIFQ